MSPSESVSPKSSKASDLSNSALAKVTAEFILPAAVAIAANAVSTDASTWVAASDIWVTALSTFVFILSHIAWVSSNSVFKAVSATVIPPPLCEPNKFLDSSNSTLASVIWAGTLSNSILASLHISSTLSNSVFIAVKAVAKSLLLSVWVAISAASVFAKSISAFAVAILVLALLNAVLTSDILETALSACVLIKSKAVSILPSSTSDSDASASNSALSNSAFANPTDVFILFAAVDIDANAVSILESTWVAASPISDTAESTCVFIKSQIDCVSSSSVLIAVKAVVISALELLLPNTFCNDFIDAYKGTKYSYSSGKFDMAESL